MIGDDHIEKRMEGTGGSPTENNWFLNDIMFSVNLRALKKRINEIIFIGIDLKRSKSDINTLILAGDIIDNIRDEIVLQKDLWGDFHR